MHPLDTAGPDVAGTTTRTGTPWMRGSGSPFIAQASSTTPEQAFGSGTELP
jgi:hypothetical protein